MRIMRSSLDMKALAAKNHSKGRIVPVSRPHLRRKLLTQKTKGALEEGKTLDVEALEDLASATGYDLEGICDLFDPTQRRGRSHRC